MRTKMLAALVLALSLPGLHSTASAEGFYLGAGAYRAEASVNSLDDSDETLGFLIGYNLIDSNVFMLSAELGSYDLGDYSSDNVDVDADAISLSAIGAIPLGPFFEIYGKIGTADVSVSVNDDNFDGSETFYGAGFSLDILDTIDIYVEYLEFDTEVDSQLIGAGIKLDLF